MIGTGHGQAKRDRYATRDAPHVPTSTLDAFYSAVVSRLENLPERIAARFASEPGAALGHVLEVEISAVLSELRPHDAGRGAAWHAR